MACTPSRGDDLGGRPQARSGTATGASQRRQVHELRHPGPREPEPPGHLSTVADNATVCSLLDLVRERQHNGRASQSANQAGCDLMSPWGERAPNVHQAAGLRRARGLPTSARPGPKCAKRRRLSHPASRRRTDSPQSHSSWRCWSDVRVQVGRLPTEVAMLDARRGIPRTTDAGSGSSR